MAAAAPLHKIGPNALTRVVEALDAFEGRSMTAGIFRACGIAHYLDKPPASMVDEQEVVAVHRALRANLGDARAQSVAWLAGRRTADYLLGHRIPSAAQSVLKALPSAIASRLLLRAIAQNAWTFAGSGAFGAKPGHPLVIAISDCPICRGETSSEPCCGYYAATFERLFTALVHPATIVTETACIARGDTACAFDVRWSGLTQRARMATPYP